MTAANITELFDTYLRDQLAAREAGFAGTDDMGEVIPHEAGPVQPVDPRLAWDGATAALTLARPEIKTTTLQRPTDWASLVAMHEPAGGLALAAGNFPQLVRNLHALLQAQNLADLRPGKSQPLHAPALLDWAAKSAREEGASQALLALGLLRLARQFEAATKLLTELKANTPAEWRDALANEEAALAWHAGRADEAIRIWNALPHSAPVLFNRGMAALFTGHAVEARTALTQAAAQLPEQGAWHHLARLYLALAQR